MNNKKIHNIVFYKSYNNDIENKQACIFYNDGTVVKVSYDEGIDACQKIVKERNITSKDSFKDMINNNVIHVMSGNDFENRFNEFTFKNNVVEEEKGYEDENDNTDDEYDNYDVELNNNDYNEVSDDEYDDYDDYDDYNEVNNDEYDDNNYNDMKSDNSYVPPVPVLKFNRDKKTNNDSNDIRDRGIKSNLYSRNNDRYVVPRAKMSALVNDNDDDVLEASVVEPVNSDTEKKGLFSRAINKIKNTTPVKKIVAFTTAAAILVGGGAYTLSNKDKVGEVLHSFFPAQAEQSDTMQETVFDNVGFFDESAPIVFDETSDIVLTPSNDNYYGYSYDQLLNVTNNNYQKVAMTNLGNTIQLFNGSFADGHVEEGKDIRAALSFEELVSLQNAYNDYSIDQIKAYFNGAEIRANDMVNAYKSANLQLMGAHVIENRVHPVDMSLLIESEEGKAFYARYHELFLAAKEATGEEKLARINAFYQAVREDFPITEEIRTEGIAHSDPRNSIEPYKLSVTPMIAAAEIIFQNYEHDYTLDDSQIDFLNDLGLCNYAENAFNRVEQITLNAKISYGEDDTNPLYEQYRDSIIKMMTDRGQYVIDDAHRELSLLDAFQETVNWHFDEGEWIYVGGVYYTTETHTEVETHTETETYYHEVEERRELPITDEAREEVDRQIEAENERARREAEEAAERERQRLQEEADREAERVKEEVRRDEEDLQQDIEDANERIRENNQDDDPTNDTPVNEEDFGDHNVDFDDDHSDEHGNLDDSVENITTDGSDVKTESDLPDPNKTGARFNEEVSASNGFAAANSNEGVHEEAPVEEHHEERHEEVHVEAPVEEHHEERHEEVHEEAPVEHHEEHHEEVHVEVPVEHHEERHEEHHEEVHVEAPVEHHEEVSHSNEAAVESYVESMANEIYEEEEYYYSF